MIVSSSFPISTRRDRPSPSDSRYRSSSSPDDFLQFSDVQCYTCRRRHVKCDRLLPHCAKCVKKGVPCLGYQRPLRWVEGAAFRMKSKSKPENVVNVRGKSNSALQEAAHFGLHATQNYCTGMVRSDASFLELISYHNTRICAEHISWEQSRFIIRKIASLSHETIKWLPKDIINGILGNAALHMAARNPGYQPAQRLALETKTNLFQGLHRMLQSPHTQRLDVLFCCIILMFAMDVMEHGSNKWDVHFLGAMNVIDSFGGIEDFALRYPHLRLILAQKSHFETMYPILSPLPATRPKQASRRAVEELCYDPKVRRSYFISSPSPLTLALYDMGVCTRNILGTTSQISIANIRMRDRILSDVLCFQPQDGVKDLSETYYQHTKLTEARLYALDMISRAYKGAITILVLRYLYFGLPHLVPRPQFGQSSIPLENTCPGFATDLPISDLWGRRYDIHKEAFLELANSFTELENELHDACVRYVLVPLYIFALVSRPGSAERALCHRFFKKFEVGMVEGADLTHDGSHAISSPVGGQTLEFNIPWDKLDAYSEAIEREQQERAVYGAVALGEESAPEWNWWYMLKHLDLKFVWPVTSGTMHLELGSEFWAFSILSSVVTEECFESWMQPPASSKGFVSCNMKRP